MATPQRKVSVFESKNELSEAMAKYTADLSSKFCKEKGIFTVVLTGCDLISWLGKLLQPPYLNSVEWSKWHVFWADERVVPLTHEDSNYKHAMDGFLSKVPIPSKNIYPIDNYCATKGDAEQCAVLYEECLRNLVKENIITLSPTGYPQLDLQLQGMGPDGHMASLFPGHDQIKVTGKWVTHILDSPKPPPKRITMTLPVINSSWYNLMAVCDKEQAHAAAEILKENNLCLPSALLTGQVETVWYLDKEAASEL